MKRGDSVKHTTKQEATNGSDVGIHIKLLLLLRFILVRYEIYFNAVYRNFIAMR